MGHIPKNRLRLKIKCVCIYEIIQLIVMKMKMKMKKDHVDITYIDLWSRNGHKYRKYKKCLDMMMLICTKQLNNS